MPLKLFWRNGFGYVRGSVRGIPVYEAAGTRDRALAEAYRAKREAELFESVIFGRRAPVPFRAAALSYLAFEPRRQRTIDYVARLIAHFETRALEAIGQDEADAAVTAIVGDEAAPATKARVVYTPLIAILNFGAPRHWCAPAHLQKPKPPKGKTRWLTPAEAEALIAGAAPHLKPLLIFYLSTGARVSEALDLEWRDVDLIAGAVMFRDTKSGADRRACLAPAARLALANMPHRSGKVFRRDDGEPYTDRARLEGGQIKTAFRTALRRAHIRTPTTPHDLRHSWATWFYALSKDLLLLKDEGRWATLAMVERYAHLMPSELTPGIARIWGGDHPRIGAPAVHALPTMAENAVGT